MRAKKQAMTFYPITVASAVHMDGTDKNLKDDYSEFKSEIEQARTATTGEKFGTMNERIDLEIGRLKKGFTDVNLVEQDSKEGHSIQNTCKGHIHDLIIKGRTLKNLVDKNTYNKETEYEFNSRFGRVQITQNTNCSFSDTCYFKVSITKLSECTISADHDTKPFIISFLGMNGYEKNHLTVKQWKDLKIGETIVVDGERQLSINEENILQISIGIGINFEVTDSGSTGRFKVNNCVITKDTTPQDFFEDIESFGQKEDKISILSNNKNFVKNLNDYIEEGNYVYAHPYIYFPIYYPINSNNLYCSYYCNNLPSGSYLLLTKRPVYNEEYQDVLIANKLGKLEGGKIVKSKTLNENNSNIIYLGYAIDGKKIDDIKNYIKLNDLRVQLEIGTNKTEYVCDYDKKDILLSQYGFNEGLRGIGIVADELNYIRKMAIKRIEKTIIDESKPIFISEQNDTFISFRIQIPNMESDTNYVDPSSSKRNSLCNKLDWIRRAWDLNDPFSKNLEGYSVSNIHQDIYVKIKKEKLSTADVEGFKLLLKEWKDSGAPFILYYQLKTAIETPLKEIIELSSYNDTTYVSFENTIRGTSSFKLPVDISKTLLTLVDGKESLENTVDDLSNEINQIKTYMIQVLSNK